MQRALASSALAVLALAGCRRNPDDDLMSEPPPPPAAMIAPVRESMSLDEKLARLQDELEAALREERVEDAKIRLFRAEAITDRLLESEPPIPWLAAGYDVEARLRQLQALADRVVAQLRRGEPQAPIRSDVARLRRQVAALRSALAAPAAGAAPPPLDSLLAAVPPDSLSATVNEGPTGE